MGASVELHIYIANACPCNQVVVKSMPCYCTYVCITVGFVHAYMHYVRIQMYVTTYLLWYF